MESLREIAGGVRHDKDEHTAKQNGRYQIDAGKLMVDCEGHDHRHNQAGRARIDMRSDIWYAF